MTPSRFKLRRRSAQAQPKAAPTALPTGPQLLKRSWRDYQDHWKLYAWVTGVLALPLCILNQFSSASSTQDNMTLAYISVAWLVMNVTLLYVVGQVADGQVVAKARLAYYAASVALVRAAIVIGVLAVLLIPMALGLLLFINGAAPADGQSLGLSGTFVVGLAAFVVSIPSWWLLTRFGLGLLAVVQDGYEPKAALRFSRQLSRGRFWRVLGRVMFLVLAAVVLSGLVYVPLAGIGLALPLGSALGVIYQTAAAVTVTPLAFLYLTKLYRDLKATV